MWYCKISKIDWLFLSFQNKQLSKSFFHSHIFPYFLRYLPEEINTVATTVKLGKFLLWPMFFLQHAFM